MKIRYTEDTERFDDEFDEEELLLSQDDSEESDILLKEEDDPYLEDTLDIISSYHSTFSLGREFFNDIGSTEIVILIDKVLDEIERYL